MTPSFGCRCRVSECGPTPLATVAACIWSAAVSTCICRHAQIQGLRGNDNRIRRRKISVRFRTTSAVPQALTTARIFNHTAPTVTTAAVQYKMRVFQQPDVPETSDGPILGVTSWRKWTPESEDLVQGRCASTEKRDALVAATIPSCRAVPCNAR